MASILIEIRKLRRDDVPAYWSLRLEALETEPLAFGMSAEEHRAKPIEWFAERFEDKGGDFTLGAFAEGKLIGTATFLRERGLKERHKGRIVGVYVTASHRGQGAGRALIHKLLEKASEDTSLEQILLSVAACQEAAGQLYREFGFESYGIEPRALKIGSEYVDEHHMMLLIHRCRRRSSD